MIRAFLAVELGDVLTPQVVQVQQELKQRLGRDLAKGVRLAWVQPSLIHLTIKFLGDTDEALIDPLREALAQAVASHQRIQIPLERLGVFPRPEQPRVLWVGAGTAWEQGQGARQLASLHQAVEACCESQGFAPEGRPLSPHLTLARIKEGERLVGQALAKSGVMDRALSLEPLTVGAIALMKSDLRPTGPVYTKLWEAKLTSE